MGMADVAAQVHADQVRQVRIATWGHLAPEKNVTYPITFVGAVGYFNEDTLNPILMTVSDDGPWYGPWFYESVREFMSRKIGSEENSGKLFEFKGHWRNYKFVGRFKEVKLYDPRKGQRCARALLKARLARPQQLARRTDYRGAERSQSTR